MYFLISTVEGKSVCQRLQYFIAKLHNVTKFMMLFLTVK